MNCTNCGKELSPEAKFCLECGTKAPEPMVNQVLNCAKCGKELPNGAKFCLECGTPVAAIQKNCAKCGKELAPEAKFCLECGTPVAAIQKNCAKCGKELAPEAKFCLECGTKVGAPAKAPPASAPQADQVKMIPVTSDKNPWSYEVPAFLIEDDSLGMVFSDDENWTSSASSKFPFGYVISRVIHGSILDGTTFDSLSTVIKNVTQNIDIISEKIITINGLSANYFQMKDSSVYYHYAFLEKNGFYYSLMIMAPLELKDKGVEEIDAFIYSFKLNANTSQNASPAQNTGPKLNMPF